MNTGLRATVSHLLLLILASVCCGCSALSLPCHKDGYSGKNSHFYRQLESALLNNPDGLYALHTAFFEPNRVPREVAQISLHLKISHMGPSNCTTAGPNQWSSANGTRDTSGSNDSQYIWTFKWSSSAVLSQINMGELLVFDNILTSLLYSRVSASYHRTANITLHVPSLPCKLTDGDVLSTVIAFLTWSKAYARDQARPITRRDEDRGYISLTYNYWATEGISDTCKFDTIQRTRISLLVLYISLNLLVPVLLAKFGTTYYFKISRSILTSGPTFVMYWAIVIVLAFCNTFSLTISTYMYRVTTRKNPNLYFITGGTSDKIAAFTIKITLLLLVYTLEVLIATRIPKDTKLPIPSVIRKLFFCFSISTQSKIIQTLATWHIMVFIQGLAMSAIPVGIFLLIIPLWVILVLGIYACFMLFAIVIVAYLLHHCTTKENQKHSCNRCATICLRFTGITLSLLIFVTLLTVYLFMAFKISGGVSGFLVSFLPPIILSLIGWCIKKTLLGRSHQATSYDAQSPGPEEEMDAVGETDPLIDVAEETV